MNHSVTLQNLDEATGNWLFSEAQKRNVSLEAITLEIIRKGIDANNADAELLKRKEKFRQLEQQWIEAYTKFPVQPDEFEIDEEQLVWGDESTRVMCIGINSKNPISAGQL